MMWLIIKLAWQQLHSQWRSGDVRVLVMALILAVAAITAVQFFTQRIAGHLNHQGGMLLGGDAVIVSDHPLPQDYRDQAKKYRLESASSLEFASMAIHKDRNQLAEVKAIDERFPLIGDFGVQITSKQTVQQLKTGPAPGEVWIEPKLAHALHVKLGDRLELGATDFLVSGILVREPSRGGDMFSFAPRVMMHMRDVAATELIQFGSRVKYQLILAGNSKKLQQFTSAMTPQLQRGERIEDVKTARPEIRSALEKAEIFLGLSAMVSVVLAIVAMLLASMPFILRNQETAALLRCFGASKANIEAMMLFQTAILASIGGLLGCLLGYFVQFGLAYFAGKLFLESLPAPNFSPVGIGLLLSFAILFSIMWPHIRALRYIPTIQILRRQFIYRPGEYWSQYLPICIVISLLIFLLAKTTALASAFLVGMFILSVLAGILGYGLALGLQYMSRYPLLPASISLGLGNIKRRLGLSIAMIIGFSLGAMALMLLVMIKTDLLESWQASLPEDAPNRFIINIQPHQVDAVKNLIQQMSGRDHPQIFPMIRGRLIEKNGKAVVPERYEEERARRLASREFNLSSAAHMQADNQLIQGRWWREDESAEPLISIEQDIAKALGIQLGDTLTYDIAGTKIKLTVTSIRKVEWDSMRANFFVVTPPNTLKPFNASYMTAFYLPQQKDNQLNLLLQQYPNLTVIDVASIMMQVREIMSKLSIAVGFVFGFCVLASMVVLYAALVATRHVRLQEATLLRAFGASRKQVSTTILTEFACISFLSASVAVIVAIGLSGYLSHFILIIPYHFNPSLTLSVYVFALIIIPLAAWQVVRGYLNVAPKQLLNSI